MHLQWAPIHMCLEGVRSSFNHLTGDHQDLMYIYVCVCVASKWEEVTNFCGIFFLLPSICSRKRTKGKKSSEKKSSASYCRCCTMKCERIKMCACSTSQDDWNHCIEIGQLLLSLLLLLLLLLLLPLSERNCSWIRTKQNMLQLN